MAMQALATSLNCPSELGFKTLSLKTPHILLLRYKENSGKELKIFCWLAFTVLEEK